MICALWDYWHFRNRAGHWSRFAPHSVMGGAYLERIPPDVVRVLRAGDTIFCCQYDSVISWAVAYFTSAQISHVAMCSEPGFVTHATLAGVIEEPLEALSTPGARLLPVLLPVQDDARRPMLQLMRHTVGISYGWAQVGRKSVNILSGRDAPYYRLRFFTDIAATLLLFDVPALAILHRPLLVWLLIPYSLWLVANRIRWRLQPLAPGPEYDKPVDVLDQLLQIGGQPLLDPAAVAVQARLRADR